MFKVCFDKFPDCARRLCPDEASKPQNLCARSTFTSSFSKVSFLSEIYSIVAAPTIELFVEH